jgi:hypothetical protein
MNYPSEPTPGPTPVPCTTNPKPKIVRIEYSRSTKADCALAWGIFSDCARWHHFSDAYRSIVWRGAPWVPGSRLQIEIVRPVVATQDRVITLCEPPRCVAWINHVLGYTMEQWVLFDPEKEGGTRVSTWIEITGVDVDGQDVEKQVTEYLDGWMVKFCAECDGVASKS